LFAVEYPTRLSTCSAVSRKTSGDFTKPHRDKNSVRSASSTIKNSATSPAASKPSMTRSLGTQFEAAATSSNDGSRPARSPPLSGSPPPGAASKSSADFGRNLGSDCKQAATHSANSGPSSDENASDDNSASVASSRLTLPAFGNFPVAAK